MVELFVKHFLKHIICFWLWGVGCSRKTDRRKMRKVKKTSKKTNIHQKDKLYIQKAE